MPIVYTCCLCLFFMPMFCCYREVEQRIANWSDKLCARLDEVLETFKKESAMSLARAAEAHCVPYIFALIWFIK